MDLARFRCKLSLPFYSLSWGRGREEEGGGRRGVDRDIYHSFSFLSFRVHLSSLLPPPPPPPLLFSFSPFCLGPPSFRVFFFFPLSPLFPPCRTKECLREGKTNNVTSNLQQTQKGELSRIWGPNPVHSSGKGGEEETNKNSDQANSRKQVSFSLVAHSLHLSNFARFLRFFFFYSDDPILIF